MSGKKISLRCQCTCLETMSHEGSPVRGVRSFAVRGERSSASESGYQLAQLLEEIRRLQEGQEDVALIMERGAHRNPHIFKRSGNKNQYRFCKELADRVTTASSSVARVERGSGKAAFDRAKEILLSSGVWPLLSNLDDPELRRLAKALPATVLKSKADSTIKKYLGAFQMWKTWAEARRGAERGLGEKRGPCWEGK